MTAHCPTQTTVAQKAVSLLCLTLFLFLQAAAAVPGFHQYLHHDADQADHQCAVTLLSQGNLQIASNVTPIVLPASFVVLVPLRPATVQVVVDQQLPPGRAPPASCLG
jgi:hypothetical protein